MNVKKSHGHRAVCPRCRLPAEASCHPSLTPFHTPSPIPPQPELRVGQYCLGQFSLDNQWYRAYVERVNAKDGTFDVFFLDYGNRERLPGSRVRVMDAALAAVPPQAHQATLAYVKVRQGGGVAGKCGRC